MNTKAEVGHEFLKKLAEGVAEAAAPVECTLGPRGRNVIIEKESKTILTKDGHTVAKSFVPDNSDPIKKFGAKILSEVTSQTVDTAGDGTTTATVLFNSILHNGVKYRCAGLSPSEISEGMKYATHKAVQILSSKSLKIGGEKEDISRIIQVATISANGDKSIGNMIGEMIQKVGSKGIITVQKGSSIDTKTDCIDGIRFDSPFLSRSFITDTKTGRFEFEDAYVLVYEKKLDSQQDFSQIVSIIEKINVKPILIICEGIEGFALRAIATNNIAGITKICVVKYPGYGESRKENCEDIALFCGGTYISEEAGRTLESVEIQDLGKANVIVDDKKTTILNGNGNRFMIEEKCDIIKKKISEEHNSYAKEKLEKRLGNLRGKAGVINVGGMNDLDQERKMAAIDDALKAVQAAVEEGILPGGGSSYIRAKKELTAIVRDIKKSGINKNGENVAVSDDFISGMNCIVDALSRPIMQSLKNADMENKWQLIVNDIENNNDSNFGFNVAEGAFCNMLESGIIDPCLCVTSSLNNAGHFAAEVISSGAIIYNKPKAEKEKNMDMDGMY